MSSSLSLARLLRQLDPIGWPRQVAVGLTVAMFALPILVFGTVVDVPLHLVGLPLAGVMAGRTTRLRWRDIATWTVPLAVALWLTWHFAPPALLALLNVLLLTLTAAMIFSPLGELWMARVAPGRYTRLAPADQRFDDALRKLDYAAYACLDRVRETEDTSAFEREFGQVRAQMEALTPPAEWAQVYEQWLNYWSRFYEFALSYPSDAGVEHHDRFRADVLDALQAVRDSRLNRLGRV
jgi:hypothetical protein